MQNTEEQIANYLGPFNDEIGLLAQQLRSYLKKTTEPTIELIADSYLSLNIGYGFTEKAWDCYCAIIVYSKHINISFPSGAFLPDPQNLLQGMGKRVRHIKVKEVKDLKKEAVHELLLAARDRAKSLVEENSNKSGKIKTVIKSISGKKNRPGIIERP